MSMPGPPHSEPPRWPGQTSVSGASVSSRSCRLRKISRAPSSRSIARSGRAASPTNSESPVRTAQGSSPRAGVDERERGVLGPVPGGVDRPHGHRAELELPAVVEGLVVVLGLRQPVDVDRGAGGRGQPPVARHVVRVVVGLEHVVDLHAEVARELEVLADLEAGVHHRRDARVVVADEIRGAAQVVMGDLPEDHVRISHMCNGQDRGSNGGTTMLRAGNSASSSATPRSRRSSATCRTRCPCRNGPRARLNRARGAGGRAARAGGRPSLGPWRGAAHCLPLGGRARRSSRFSGADGDEGPLRVMEPRAGLRDSSVQLRLDRLAGLV